MAYWELSGHQRCYSRDKWLLSTNSLPLTERMSVGQAHSEDIGQITAAVSACRSNLKPPSDL
ncbi:hypothetical protein [Paenibacillus sp. N3.4]|uniref:hypothetical protein n=1 Tax=Paenibacillus sp. N3.4 TaxID=2603222 RepID=UPI00164EF628|nr:hypothetical protein [Paenibacillus sp. N3.4]